MGKETTIPTPTTIIARPHEEENLHGEGTAGGGGGGGCWCGWFRTRTTMFCELNTSGRKPDLADLATHDPSAGTWHDSIRLYIRRRSLFVPRFLVLFPRRTLQTHFHSTLFCFVCCIIVYFAIVLLHGYIYTCNTGLWVGAFVRKKKPDTTTRKSKSNFVCDGGGWMRSEKQRTSFLLVVQDEVIKQPGRIKQDYINTANPTPIETVPTAALVSRRSVSHNNNNNPTTLRHSGRTSSTGTTKNTTSRSNRTNTNNNNINIVTRNKYANLEETTGTNTTGTGPTGPTARRTNNLNNNRTVLHNRSNTQRSTTVVQSRMMTPKSNIRSPGTGGTSTSTSSSSKSQVPIPPSRSVSKSDNNNNNIKRWY